MGKPLIPITLGIVFAAVAAFMTLGYLKQASTKPAAPQLETQAVVIATGPILRGETVSAEKVKVIAWPKTSAPAGAYSSLEQTIGMVARASIFENDPITEHKVVDSDSKSVLSMLIPDGRRAIAIKVNEVTGIAGFVAPSSRIDVLVTVPEKDDDPARTRIVLQDIEVLAVAQAVEQRENKPVVVNTVTLNVLPAEAEALTLAANEGSLQLTMRNDRDQARVYTAGISLDHLVGTANPGNGGAQVELIRGVNREVQSF
jgi:pilus assembly protein CpaB